MRKVKKSRVKSEYLDFYKKTLDVSRPTMCLTHDIDEGYEPNLDKMVDLEKKHGVNSTMFLLNMSMPSKNWLQKNRNVDFQFHSNFISSGNVLKDKKEMDGLVGKKTTINRSHQYVLPSLDRISPYFKADSTYNNWSNMTLFKPFLLKQGLVELPVFPEIPFINLKNMGTIKKIWGEIFKTSRKVNGLVVTLTHPTPFKEYGQELEEFFITQKGFEIKTLSEVLKDLK
jgi:hypothetical protein